MVASSILLLPSELKRRIAELSSDSPKSLAALALTHTSYHREAERALYDIIYISTYHDYSVKCMKTLAANPEKAALVHFLIIEYSRDSLENNRGVTTYLTKSLINMHSLSDFRVRSRPDGDGAKMKRRGNRLGKILCEGHFRLQALYFDSVLDISEIIKSQTELQILGSYSPGGASHIPKILRELDNAQLFLPIVLTMERESFTPYTDHICIFPAFYSADRCATMHQVLAQSFSKDQGNYMDANVDNIRELDIYLIDSSDMPSITALAKNMAVTFPNIGYVNLCFEHRCEIPSEEIKEKFSFFSNLRGLSTYVWF